jgi:hypothetical protein
MIFMEQVKDALTLKEEVFRSDDPALTAGHWLPELFYSQRVVLKMSAIC